MVIIEGIDELQNLHLGLSIVEAKLLVAILEQVPKEAYEAAHVTVKAAHMPLKVTEADLVYVVGQTVFALSPITNQLDRKLLVEAMPTINSLKN